MFTFATLLTLYCVSTDTKVQKNLLSFEIVDADVDVDDDELSMKRNCKGDEGEFGCYLFFCWKYCGPKPNSTEVERPWCYTTRGQEGDGGYIACLKDEECKECWNCAGTCSP